jgi:hypothetical protein
MSERKFDFASQLTPAGIRCDEASSWLTARAVLGDGRGRSRSLARRDASRRSLARSFVAVSGSVSDSGGEH